MSIKEIFKCFVLYAPSTWEECPMTADLQLQQEKEKCFSYAQLLTDLFQLKVKSDDPDIHPPKFCNSCATYEEIPG